ncbi:MAG: hypothetical protein HYZ29_00180 [Myxococcales bacterium]|nr:hypothetical protein [Myxococcales bacterium]
MAPGHWLSACVLLAGCARSPRVSGADRVRALRYESRARAAASLPEALHFATRALVVRLAACGFDCPDPAYSLVQLGDLRLLNHQPDHAAQSYARAIMILEPHRETHGEWLECAALRLQRACASAKRAPACAAAEPRH